MAGRSQWHGRTDGRTDRRAGGRRRARAGRCPSPWHQGMRAGSSSKASPHPPSRPQATLLRAPRPAPRGGSGCLHCPGAQQHVPSVAATGGQTAAPTDASGSHPRCVSPSQSDRDSPWVPGLTGASHPPASSGAGHRQPRHAGCHGGRRGAGSQGTGTAGDRAGGSGTAKGWPPAPQTLPSGLWCQRRTRGCPRAGLAPDPSVPW